MSNTQGSFWFHIEFIPFIVTKTKEKKNYHLCQKLNNTFWCKIIKRNKCVRMLQYVNKVDLISYRNIVYIVSISAIHPKNVSSPSRYLNKSNKLTPSKYIMTWSSSRSTRLTVGSSFSCGDKERKDWERIKHCLQYLSSKECQSPSSVTHSLQRRLIQLKPRQEPDVNDHHVGLLSCAVIPVIQALPQSQTRFTTTHCSACSLTDS